MTNEIEELEALNRKLELRLLHETDDISDLINFDEIDVLNLYLPTLLQSLKDKDAEIGRKQTGIAAAMEIIWNGGGPSESKDMKAYRILMDAYKGTEK